MTAANVPSDSAFEVGADRTPDPNAVADGHPENCQHVLERVYEFLDHELDDASGDAIRQHLADCEPCLDTFDVEQAVKSLVNRCCGNETAPAYLRAKIVTQMTIIRRSSTSG